MSHNNGGYDDSPGVKRRSVTIDYSARPVDDGAAAIDKGSPVKAGGKGVMQKYVIL